MTRKTYDKILKGLQECERREGEFPPFIQFYRELLQMQCETQSRIIISKPQFPEGLVSDRLSQGIPLLLFGDFSPDWLEVQRLFEKVSNWVGKGSKTPLGEGERLRKIGCDRLLLAKLAETWYQGHSLVGMTVTEDVDGELLTSVTSATMTPFLSAYAKLLLPEVRQELWRRRYCPICGGSPGFAFLDRERGARWLLCSRCDAEWLFQRLECPYCGATDPGGLAYFTDDKGIYRLYVCERCRNYLKAIDLRQTQSELLLPLERWLTLGLDIQAEKQGYLSPVSP